MLLLKNNLVFACDKFRSYIVDSKVTVHTDHAAINVANSTPWYADYANYIVSKYLPPSFTYQQNKKFFYDLRHYFWVYPHLYKEGVDGIIRCCVPQHE